MKRPFLKDPERSTECGTAPSCNGKRVVREENYEKALDYYKNSLELDPLYHAAYNNIGTIYSKHGLYDHRHSLCKLPFFVLSRIK